MKNTIRTVFLAVTIIMATQASVSAIPVSNGTQTDQSQLEEVKDKREEIELSIEKLDNQIEKFMMDVENNKSNIKTIENEINNSKGKIEQIEKESVEKQEILDNRLKLAYMNGNLDYFKVIFESKSLSDFVSRISAIKKIATMDKKIIDELKNNKEKVEIEKSELEEKHSKISALNFENENKLANLNSNKEKQKSLINEMKAKERLLTARTDESNELVSSVINEVRKEAPKATRGVGSSASGQNIIAYASNFIGIPYLWGGTNPSTGFDCSGFTQYVFAHFGIKLGRTTYNQINDGYAVSKGELQAGDLVFFGKNNDPTHMGIYIGNNTYIHSPQTGDVLKISPMTRKDYITARRVL
ncbi:NlpC/P60 family protein [Clostridium cibarium]|uniref:C40 family peptidase n=1 Tax=Clostridium cibarium TaxID=2762247 RepID=A0ABR8PW46_9CLOT|nr:C40 family peptidase [Clostridium cibarium]MBD7912418.1 C40 family peptidase [Clostridium cibarium]